MATPTKLRKTLALALPGTPTPDQINQSLSNAEEEFHRVAVSIAALQAAAGLLLTSAGSSLVLVNGTFNAIPGLTLTLSKAGLWLVFAAVDFAVLANDANIPFAASLFVAGIQQTGTLNFMGPVTSSGSSSYLWSVRVPNAGQAAVVKAKKTGGAGASTAANGAGSVLAGLWITA